MMIGSCREDVAHPLGWCSAFSVWSLCSSSEVHSGQIETQLEALSNAHHMGSLVMLLGLTKLLNHE
jgi:hypothetical protein